MQLAATEEELKLVERIKNDDRMAMERVYNDNYRLIEKYVLLNSGTQDDAKDAYQETMMIFFRKVKDAEFQLTSKVNTLIYGICRNVWLKQLEKERLKEKHIKGFEVEYDFDNGSDELADHERINLVRKCLKGLGEPCGTILRDFFFGGLNMQEIAQKMGYTNADNAKNQKYKCMGRLKKLIVISNR